MPAGIEVRHEERCRKTKIKGRDEAAKEARKKARCNCNPSYRAWVFDAATSKPVKRPWTKDEGRAKSERRDLEVRVEKDEVLVSAEPVFTEWVQEVFLPGIASGAIHSDEGEPYKPSTERSYRSALTKHVVVAAEFKNKRFDQITQKDVRDFVARKMSEGPDNSDALYTAGAIHKIVNPMRAAFRYAIYHHLTTNNPLTDLKLPRAGKRVVVMKASGEKGEMVIRDADEVIEMIEVLPEHLRAMFATAALAGLRRGELRALRIRHIDFFSDVPTINVRLSMDQLKGEVTLKSNAGRRDVPIIEDLRPYLAAQVASLGLDARPDDKVFPPLGKRVHMDPTDYLERCRVVWGEHDIAPLGLHDARHTFASLLIASGADMKQISSVMGHASIKVTYDIYGHLLPSSNADLYEKMNAFMRRSRATT